MYVINLTSNVIFLGRSSSYRLDPSATLYVPDNIYSGNDDINSAIDHLLSKGVVEVIGGPDNFPVSIPQEEKSIIPETYELLEQDLVISKNQGVAGLSVESDVDQNTYYGALNLRSSNESEAGVYAYKDSEDAGMFYASKSQSNPQKFFKLLTDGFPATIAATGASVEDIAALLIDLGLAAAEE